MNDTTEKIPAGKEKVGKVLSAKMKNTVIVGVTQIRMDPLYKKGVRSLHKFAAHCEIEGIGEGDEVKIREVKPISKTKHFIVIGKVVR